MFTACVYAAYTLTLKYLQNTLSTCADDIFAYLGLYSSILDF
jgi:hypothetical protein